MKYRTVVFTQSYTLETEEKGKKTTIIKSYVLWSRKTRRTSLRLNSSGKKKTKIMEKNIYRRLSLKRNWIFLPGLYMIFICRRFHQNDAEMFLFTFCLARGEDVS